MIDPTNKQTIMVVDDSPLNIKVLIETFGEEFDVSFATSGKEALQMAAENLPDLILLDIQMPDGDGYAVCKALKSDPLLRDTVVIFITAMSQEEDEITGLELGAVDYITTPFNPTIARLRVRNQLELKRLRDVLARLSHRDGLTGIPNRRAFDECLQREWRRALRNGTTLALILMDIDHFKAYNDSLGHLEGDDCLKKVANGLAGSMLRAGDFVARYGGEEFACILPETDEKGVVVVAERMRQSVGSLQIAHGMSPVAAQVTVSLGCAALVPERDLTPQQLVSIADRMLYKAKEEGRNRVGRM